MLFIMVLFHLSAYKNFKTFYLHGIGCQYRACFRDLPHYDRFISLMPRLFVPLMVLLHSLSGEQSGVSFADSTKLAVCHNRRIDRHKVFDGLAARAKTSVGWFYGLKLHVVINHKGQIMALRITPGNTADSTVLNEMTQHLTGKLYADKGYIGRELFTKLWQRGLHLITGIRRNMRNYLMPLGDKLMLRKRWTIDIDQAWRLSRIKGWVGSICNEAFWVGHRSSVFSSVRIRAADRQAIADQRGRAVPARRRGVRRARCRQDWRAGCRAIPDIGRGSP
ncbi:MAG: IS982 family transposase [Rhodopila sp.]